METLTGRQQAVLDLIRRHIEESGFPPTRAEIAGALGFRSANAAEQHLRALARKGAVELLPGSSRGIRLRGEQDAGLPVIGRVAAGAPIRRVPIAAEDVGGLGGLGIFVKKEFDRRGVFGEQGEIRAFAIPGGAEGIGFSRPDLQRTHLFLELGDMALTGP